MAVVMRCDRCKKDTDNFIEGEIPDGWRYLRVLQRGSQGAWSDGPEHLICYECDKALYEWFHDHRALLVPVEFVESVLYSGSFEGEDLDRLHADAKALLDA